MSCFAAICTNIDFIGTDPFKGDFFSQDKSTQDKSAQMSQKKQPFKLPIHYLEESAVHALNPIVAKDLELVADPDSVSTINKGMYDYVFQETTSPFSKDLLPQWKTHYTTDVSFLLQTQEVIQTIPDVLESEKEKEAESKYEVPCEKIKNIWEDVKNDPSFMEKYGYLEWSFLDEWNRSAVFLQILSFFNIISPIMSFLIPIFILIFPFILLKIKNIPITVNEYVECLIQIAKSHFIGKALLSFRSLNAQSVMYIIASFGLYLLQMYQNTMQCIRFYKNIQHINDSLCEMKLYVNDSIHKMNRFIDFNRTKTKFKGFCNAISQQKEQLENIRNELSAICPFQCSIYKTAEIGYMLKCFYILHTNAEYEEAILYSMGFEGYLQQMKSIGVHVQNGTLGHARFTDTPKEVIEINLDSDNDSQSSEKKSDKKEDDEEEKPDDEEENEEGNEERDERKEDDEEEESNKPPTKYILNQYYPPHIEDLSNCVKNNANLDKKMIISGPNASGKTTFLKTTAINLIFSQQFGFGFYSDSCIVPYTHFHSYLNIPDTSGRDSLFQAESRRCKEILDIIQLKQGRHFSIFDELYSGTNPVEASKSAYAFLKYLCDKHSHVDFIMTTHYVSVCEKWKGSDKPIYNYRMGVSNTTEGGSYKFTYQIERGISRIQGALQILEEMDYPEDILNIIRDNDIM